MSAGHASTATRGDVGGRSVVLAYGSVAAEYEALQHEKGSATQGMDAQSLAHVFVAICILMGNLVQWQKRGGTR